ncbi:hypothetical protein Tco_1416646 [Tanacetum coccineum]
MRRCVAGNEILEIFRHCHSRPTRGHHSASITGRKVYVGFKRLQDILRVTAAQLQLMSDYYCWKEYADRDEIKD